MHILTPLRRKKKSATTKPTKLYIQTRSIKLAASPTPTGPWNIGRLDPRYVPSTRVVHVPDSFPRRARAIPSCRGSRIYTLPLWCRTSDGVLLYSLVQRFCRPSWCPTECTSTWQLEKHPKGDFCGSSKNHFTLQVTKTLKLKWISKKQRLAAGTETAGFILVQHHAFHPISMEKEPSTMDPACTCTMPKDICWSSRANVWFGYGPSF